MVECGMGIGFRDSIHHAASYLQVPLLVLGCTLHFMGSIVRQVPVVRFLCRDGSAGADGTAQSDDDSVKLL
jgi:hypothetical protein